MGVVMSERSVRLELMCVKNVDVLVLCETSFQRKGELFRSKLEYKME